MSKSTLETLLEEAENNNKEEIVDNVIAEDENIEAQLEEVQQKAKEYENKYKYAMADMDNVRKQAARRVSEATALANERFMIDVLCALDDFELAEKNGELTSGTSMVFSKLKSILESKGLAKIEIGENATFNTDFHEAIAEIPSEAEKSGCIVDCVLNGYTLNGKVIRHSKVVVGKSM